jgi:hypothetical protein
MGNGVLFNRCCNINDNNAKDVDINKMNSNNMNSNMNTVKDIYSPGKEMKKNYDDITKTDIKTKTNNNFGHFKKRNFTQGGHKRVSNSDFIQNQNISLFNNTFQILKNNQYISFSNMNIFRHNLNNNRMFNSYFNSQLGKNSSFYFSGVNDKFDSNFQKIKTSLKLTGELFLNKTLEIDKFGLKKSLKKKIDGIISFGIKAQDEPPNINKYDYIFEQKIVQKINKKRKHNTGKVFEILLDRRDKRFVLFYEHSSLLLYYKINNKLNLEYDKDYYLILGSIFLSINIKRSLKIKINIQIELENEKSQKYIFEIKDLPIKIGRSNCNINIPKPSVSKLHSCIDYENDTFFYKDENSTNGSTLLIKEDDFLKLKGIMNFKLEDIPFTIKESNGNIENEINVDNDEEEEDEEEEEK